MTSRSFRVTRPALAAGLCLLVLMSLPGAARTGEPGDVETILRLARKAGTLDEQVGLLERALATPTGGDARVWLEFATAYDRPSHDELAGRLMRRALAAGVPHIEPRDGSARHDDDNPRDLALAKWM